MEKEQRIRLQKATQDARRLLEEEFRSQLLETYDINVAVGRWNEEPGTHLQAEQRLIREKLVAWIEHKEAQINDRKEALLLTLREMAFTALNRFVALKLMEARELVRPCVSGGLESAGFQEFIAVAQGLLTDQEGSYRLYLETIFEDVSRELRALFDPRDLASLLWPKRTALLKLLEILNRPELAELWVEDETIGWVYQYFNGNDVREMRDAAKGGPPRNSRELAVRNQFFTPRYVVEFLTDNTLGRIWYEMRQGNTGLKERCRYLVRRPNEIWLEPGEEAPAEVLADDTLTQEELLRQPVHIPNRPLKDPREIRMLDPACGSMHFGLYAFDLYLEIYEEAWEIAQVSDDQAEQGEAFAPFVAYAANFANKAAFLREVPRLILLHNIHGIDIDPRATQIARLTIWLRAQRAWQEEQLKVADRPLITRSNVVCAEPMPGERELLAEFVDQQFPDTERDLVQQLLETIIDKMQLAGEAGSLLKIEEEIRDAIDEVRREWQKLAVRQQDLFNPAELTALGQVGSSLNTDTQNLIRDFWIDIEERIYTALRAYAEQVESGGSFQRRLFAEDAAQGFAFIDVCRKRYDAVVMNPPFGLPTNAVFDLTKIEYPDTYVDLYGSFVCRGTGLCANGLIGAITPRTFIAGSKMSGWRSNSLAHTIELMADLGIGVMDDAMVRSCAYVTRTGHSPFSYITAWDARVDDKSAQLKAFFSDPDYRSAKLLSRRFVEKLAGNKLLYFVSEGFAQLMLNASPLEPQIATVRGGLRTFNDERYLRLRWEINPACIGKGKDYDLYAKGGEYANYYTNIHLLVFRRENGKELCETNRLVNGQTAQVRQGESFYYKPSCQYTTRSKGFSARAIPSGCVMSSNAPVVLTTSAMPIEYLLGWVNSRLIRSLIEMQSMADDFVPGTLKSLPWIQPEIGALNSIASKSLQLVSCYRNIASFDETDSFFYLPAGIRPSKTILESGEEFALASNLLCDEIRSLQASITDAVDKTYELDSRKLGEEVLNRDVTNEIPDTEEPLVCLAMSVASYVVGCIFGRWDIRHATSGRPAPDLPDPFAPLNVCPPGMLRGNSALPFSTEVDRHLRDGESYPIDLALDGILLDDPQHPLDLLGNIQSAFTLIWRDRAASIQQEVCELLGVSTLREWFQYPSNFFADHLKRYSKSRRQAPIYWQLSAGNDNYSVWLYYHRFTQDTLYRVLRDFVEPRIQQAERDQFELESQGALSADAATRLLEAQSLLLDLKLLKSELELVAPLWNPNLNDGVIINHSILWRITPYTPWQKKCKECWDKLVGEEYDWAHLAFHLWPERVIKKCQSDRSLAIAHGLEDRLWQETNKGNWLQRQVSEAELQALIAEHSKPAVQNALERFLAAPPPVAAARTRAPRAAKSSSTGTTRRPRGSATAVDAEASRQTLLVLTAAPAEGLGRNAIADLLAVEVASLTAVIKQLKEGGQIEQLGAARGAKYRLTELGRAAVESQAGEES